MAARSLVSGTISFGLVAIPIRLYPAVVSERVSFHLLHAKCGSRIKYQTYCPVCDQVVDRADLVKGYELGKERYIRVTEDELEALEESIFGERFSRSSWVVLGAWGVLKATAHFAVEWANTVSPALFVVFYLFPFALLDAFGGDSSTSQPTPHPWATPVTFLVVGALLLGLGLVVARRRRALRRFGAARPGRHPRRVGVQSARGFGEGR